MGKTFEKLSDSSSFLLPVYNFVKKSAHAALCRLPVQKNKIVMDNFLGRGFGDDPKYIALELLRRKEKVKIYWLTADKETPLPKGIRRTSGSNFMVMYHLATAKIWVDNVKTCPKPPKKPGQYYIQTWHSTLGFKMNEADAPALNLEYVEQAKIDAKLTDLMYSDNDFRLDKYRNRFWYDGEVMKCGVPRMSILHHPPKELEKKIREQYDLGDARIVLYAPTFREKVRFAEYSMDIGRCIHALNERFGGEPFVMLVRLHPNELQRGGHVDVRESNVRDVTQYPDIQELLAVSDVLITDYSGCMFDCGFVNKPVFLFSRDAKRYHKEERGAYFTIEETPFSCAQSDDELCEQIRAFSEAEYEARCEQFRARVGYCDDGHGDRTLADLIMKKIKG